MSKAEIYFGFNLYCNVFENYNNSSKMSCCLAQRQVTKLLFSHKSHVLTVPTGRSKNGLLSLSQRISGVGWPSAGHLRSTVLPAVSHTSWWNSMFFAQVGGLDTIEIMYHHRCYKHCYKINCVVILTRNVKYCQLAAKIARWLYITNSTFLRT